MNKENLAESDDLNHYRYTFHSLREDHWEYSHFFDPHFLLIIGYFLILVDFIQRDYNKLYFKLYFYV